MEISRFVNFPGWNVRNNPEYPEVKELLGELARMESLVEAQKARRRELEKTWDQLAKENKLVTPSVIEKMRYDELNKLKESMLELKSGIQARIIEKQREEAAGGGGGGNYCGSEASNAIPYENDVIDGIQAHIIDDEGCSEDSAVEMLDDGVGRRFF